jgi:signal transduction histidine kinase
LFFKPPAPADDVGHVERQPSGARSNGDQPVGGGRAPAPRLLLVDDNPEIHGDIRKILSPDPEEVATAKSLAADLFDDGEPRATEATCDFQIDSAYQGQEGLQCVRSAQAQDYPYSVAFVDVRMPPGWDGIETIRRIWEVDPDLQMVICTAYSDYSWSDIVGRLKPTDGLLILRKPFDSVEIRQLAVTLSTKWRLAREVRLRLQDLEKRVEERTRALSEANRRLEEEARQRARMETELRLAQKLESVGQLASGIAHEINTPVQFVSDSLQFLRTAFADTQALVARLQDLLVNAPQLLTAGGLPAAVAEAEESADWPFLKTEVPKAFERTFDGTNRISSIVRAMKEFAHPDRREKAEADLNRALLNTLIVASNEYKYVADVETDLCELAPIHCHIGDLNQVFLNLLVNAAHAIGDVVASTGTRGKITVQSRVEGGWVQVRIADTGGGIALAARSRVYDPFFTTKPVGKGTGQGLAIARSIVVDRHQGTIDFESELGRGTTFTVRLPIYPADSMESPPRKTASPT